MDDLLERVHSILSDYKNRLYSEGDEEEYEIVSQIQNDIEDFLEEV